MNKFIGYTTYDNEDPAILSYEEYKAQSLPDDWAVGPILCDVINDFAHD